VTRLGGGAYAGYAPLKSATGPVYTVVYMPYTRRAVYAAVYTARVHEDVHEHVHDRVYDRVHGCAVYYDERYIYAESYKFIIFSM